MNKLVAYSIFMGEAILRVTTKKKSKWIHDSLRKYMSSTNLEPTTIIILGNETAKEGLK